MLSVAGDTGSGGPKLKIQHLGADHLQSSQGNTQTMSEEKRQPAVVGVFPEMQRIPGRNLKQRG